MSEPIFTGPIITIPNELLSNNASLTSSHQIYLSEVNYNTPLTEVLARVSSNKILHPLCRNTFNEFRRESVLTMTKQKESVDTVRLKSGFYSNVCGNFMFSSYFIRLYKMLL